MNKELTAKQQAFVNEYLIDKNATQAAARAGYSAKTAEKIGSENLKKPEIATAIAEALKAQAERTQIDADWVLKRLAILAGADMTQIAEWGAGGLSLHDSAELPPEATYTVTEVSCDETIKQTEGGNELILSRKTKAKQADKLRALELIMKHLGMGSDRLVLQGDAQSPVQIKFIAPEQKTE